MAVSTPIVVRAPEWMVEAEPEPDHDQIDEVLADAVERYGEAFQRVVSAPQPRRIIRAVSEETGIPVDDILGRSRLGAVTAARKLAIRRVHEAFPTFSLPRLGEIFDRDHATIFNALGRRVHKRKPRDPSKSRTLRGIDWTPEDYDLLAALLEQSPTLDELVPHFPTRSRKAVHIKCHFLGYRFYRVTGNEWRPRKEAAR